VPREETTVAELKTKPNEASVARFLEGVADPARREDCRVLVRLMREATGAQPRMWGTSVVGFGSYHYRYASGRGGDWFRVGFSPRKQDLTLYLMSGLAPHAALLGKLGKHKTGKSCLYIKRLADVDRKVLARLVAASAGHPAGQA
jgi:hypothetical protein